MPRHQGPYSLFGVSGGLAELDRAHDLEALLVPDEREPPALVAGPAHLHAPQAELDVRLPLLEVLEVQEVLRYLEMTKVPLAPGVIEGLINLRGQIVTAVDMRSRLGLPALARNDRQRIMVFTLGEQRTGFIVDSVAEVLRVPRQSLAPAPALSDAQSRMIREVARLEGQQRLIMLIDPAQLLQWQDHDEPAAMAPEAPALLPELQREAA